MKTGTQINQVRKKKGDNLYFKLECKLDIMKLMDGFTIYIINISEDSAGEEAEQLKNSLSMNHNDTNRIKIERKHEFKGKVPITEDGFSLSKFKKSEIYGNELTQIESSSNIFKFSMDIQFYKQNQDSHSSSSQVLNKQVKYSRITGKIDNLSKRLTSKSVYVSFIILFNLLMLIFLLSLVFSKFFTIYFIMNLEDLEIQP